MFAITARGMRKTMLGRKKREVSMYPQDVPDHVAVARLLLQAGASVDVQDDDGRTALHWASGNGLVAVAKVLIDEGNADMTLRSNEGSSPLRIANGQDMARLLRSRLASEKKAASKKEKPKSEL